MGTTDIAAAAAIWRRWRARLSIGVLDQLTVSGANFVLNILLARWLPPAGYGAFAVAYAVLVLVAGPHSALLIDPMNVVGPRVFRGQPARYLRVVLTLHGSVTVPLGIVVGALALWPATFVNLPAAWLVTLGVSAPAVLSLWLLRSACHFEMRPGAALMGSVLYAAGVLGLVIWADSGAWLTPRRALLLMAAASAVAAFCMSRALGLVPAAWASPDLGPVIREHWAYGRWILGASVAHAIGNGLYVPLVGVLIGLEQSGVLRALQNLLTPLQQVLVGISMVAFPFMSRRVAEEGRAYLNRRGLKFVLLIMALAAAYGMTMTVLGRPILALIYGTGYYAAYASLVPLLAGTAVASALALCLGILVRIINQPRGILWAKLGAAAWLFGAGIFLVRSLGVKGAVLGLAGGALVEVIVLTFVVTRREARIAEPLGPGAEDVL